ncbi:MAG: hypothetical protein IT175_12220 [Acidobacteria bacterium]|nr:hypothetical protein [Acidobacteriota bacterium]
MIEVFHNGRPVATVDTCSLEHAFELTNHISRPWQENEGVEAVGVARNGARSTSVGDLLVVVGAGGRRACFSVEPVGFAPAADPALSAAERTLSVFGRVR